MFDEIAKNKTKSVFLVSFFIVLIGILGAVLGMAYGNLYFGMIIAVSISIVYSIIGYYSGGSMILTMTGAKPVKKSEHPHLWHAIDGLAVAAGIPKPKAYMIEDSALNAFATGRDPKHAAITVTSGLVQKLDRQELEGVIAHEMGHIKNFDIQFMMLTSVLVGITVLLSDFILRSFLWGGMRGDSKNGITIGIIAVGLILAILTPIIGYIIKAAISRKREFMADATGAVLTRYPQGLAGALRKISKDPDPLVDKANHSTAHLFISTPFRKKTFINRIFATHPPIHERIKRLEEM